MWPTLRRRRSWTGEPGITSVTSSSLVWATLWDWEMSGDSRISATNMEVSQDISSEMAPIGRTLGLLWVICNSSKTGFSQTKAGIPEESLVLMDSPLSKSQLLPIKGIIFVNKKRTRSQIKYWLSYLLPPWCHVWLQTILSVIFAPGRSRQEI